MKKEDERHNINTRANKALHQEVDLWCEYMENGEKPIQLFKGTGRLRTYQIAYNPVHSKTHVFSVAVYSELGELLDYCGFQTIQAAKASIRRYDYTVKWTRTKGKEGDL